MTRKYIGTKIVTAYPQEGRKAGGMASSTPTDTQKLESKGSFRRVLPGDRARWTGAQLRRCAAHAQAWKESGARRLEREGHVSVHRPRIDIQGQPSAASWDLPGRHRDQLLSVHSPAYGSDLPSPVLLCVMRLASKPIFISPAIFIISDIYRHLVAVHVSCGQISCLRYAYSSYF